MNLKEITLVIRENEEPALKSILDLFKKNFSNFELTKYSKGSLGDEAIITFKVNRQFYGTLVQKLAYNDLRLFRKDEEAKEIVNKVIRQKRKTITFPLSGWDAVRSKKKTISIEQLEEFAVNGNYNELFKVLKDSINHSAEIVTLAKKLLSDSIAISINRIYSDAIERKKEPKKQLSKLLKIASDKKIKNAGKLRELKEAGFYSIELCLSEPGLFSKLIDIANGSNLPSVINIKAAIEFADKIFNDQDKYTDEIKLAIKKLNTRWLNIAVETAIKAFNQEEIELLDKLIDFINKHRKN
ncbi:hypothetical protein BMS3Abin04_00620 [bacterium BMS3Abin04]|nr:hypothetical protein BMS3Abin04_00620 [bacterium BMS3Abin04]